MEQSTITIKGMTCNHCKTAVETALTELDGVSGVEVDVKKGKADVSYDSSKVTVSDMNEAVEDQGYDVV
ncbi:copper chaperone CopZ (plasmid) [Alkalihalobacillus hwajinpoensis]|uniref:copper chaperone CopZ n=1 Tax=Guptibacillus hwajinpoensis TaxID=208199 RepID=UPI0018839DB5|nr:copper chaperone CopZ [Pseudalkalibacillus hwajinpoensis]MBF0706696.1 copper chaperone CopZ [Pseudalkalibacillus hwajinpoensis]